MERSQEMGRRILREGENRKYFSLKEGLMNKLISKRGKIIELSDK
jgi:hypothetical protein